MTVLLKKKVELFWLMALITVSWAFSFCEAYQVPFEHVVIDSDAIGHPQVADVDMDGHSDIILQVHRDDYHIRVEGRKTHLAWYRWPDYKKYAIFSGDFIGDRLAVSDLNGDGNPDIVSGKGVDNGNIEIFWYQNPLPSANPKNVSAWQEHGIGDYAGAIKDIHVGDINGDNRPDVVVRGHDATTIYFQKAKSWRTRKVAHPRKEGMALADLDTDGDLDIILNGFWLETPPNPQEADFVQHDIDRKWYTQKTGSWQDNCCYVGTADINQDGILDVVLAHSENVGYPLAWYSVDDRNKIKTGPWQEHKIANEFDWCETVDIGDVDNDGDLDVLASKFQRHNKPGEKYHNAPPYPVSMFYNASGDGKAWIRQDLSDMGIYAGLLGDLGSDGDLDIVGPRSYWTGPIEMWENKTSDQKLSLDDWTYIEVDNKRGKWGDWDEPKGLKYFGLAMADVTGDGYKDIVAGRYFYRNPGEPMTRKWQRVTFDINVDGMLFIDVDGDAFADVIGEALPDVYWIEAEDRLGNSWKAKKIGTLPKTGHVNGQGYALGQLIAGRKPEILLSSGNGIYYFEIPENPNEDSWPRTHISSQASEEGIGIGDIDGDGDLDIAAAGGGKKKGEGMMVTWWENPGNGQGNWKSHKIGATVNFADRFAIADINGDSRPDVVVSEETRKTDAHLFWFEQPKSAKSEDWKRHLVVKQFTMNSMDVADMDKDGDTDIIINEHRGAKRVQIWENDGKGNFTAHLVGQGKEGHLGARVADMDNDGDLDIVSIAWDNYKLLHLWRNDNRKGRKK